jgi:pyruvate/2-oxoglutarate dehydrogenase complex dihydrolipoamide dehydrogenase (E3) component
MAKSTSLYDVLYQRLQQEDVLFYIGYEPESFPSSSLLRLKSREGDIAELPFDAIYTGIGQELSFEELELENAGVETPEKGHLRFNEYLQTTIFCWFIFFASARP